MRVNLYVLWGMRGQDFAGLYRESPYNYSRTFLQGILRHDFVKTTLLLGIYTHRNFHHRFCHFVAREWLQVARLLYCFCPLDLKRIVDHRLHFYYV